MLRLVAIVFLIYQSVLSPLTYAFYEYETTGDVIVQDSVDEESDVLITIPSFPDQEVVKIPDVGSVVGEEETLGTGIDVSFSGNDNDAVSGENAIVTGGGEQVDIAPILSGSDDTVVSGGVWPTEEPIPTTPEIVLPSLQLEVDEYGRFFLDSVESVII